MVNFNKLFKNMQNRNNTPKMNVTAELDEDASEDIPLKSWRIVGASVVGQAHRNKQGEIMTPCQDSHKYETLLNGWNIIVVSDGAGSYENSHEGSAFTVKRVIDLIKRELQEYDLTTKEKPFNNKEWRYLMLYIFNQTLDGLKKYAKDNKIEDFHTLGCTVNVALFNHTTIYTANIGDGRAGYRDIEQNWHALITPFKGEEVGCTVFITSDYCWQYPKECIKTDVLKTDIDAVVLLSDGMEKYSFLCYTLKEDGMYHDPNEPHAPFLNANISTLKKMTDEKIENIDKEWENYLQHGRKLNEEYDDKTMVIAFL